MDNANLKKMSTIKSSNILDYMFKGSKHGSILKNDMNEKSSHYQQQKQFFKGKMFKFENVFLHHIPKHNCLRMIDYEILAYD